MTDIDAAPAGSPATTPAHGPTMLPISEAAPRLGLSPIALRSRVRRGSVHSRRGNAGQLLVEVPAGSPATAPTRAKPHAGAIAGEDADAYRDEIEEWRTAAFAARLAAAVAAAERDAAKAAHAGEVAALRELIADMRAQLAESRRPWWRRLIG